MGLWHSRGDARAWVLLAGPLFYFCALHLVFASSMRYRVPAEAPAMGLAAAGLSQLAAAIQGRRSSCRHVSRASPRKEDREMRLLRRVAKIMAWGLVLIAILIAGAGYFAYALVTDSDTAARLIKAQVARFLPRSIIDMGRVNIRLLAGEVTVSHIQVRQRIDGQPFVTARIPWLSVRIDARQMIHGKFEAREVTVSQPTLRLCQRKDGTWNLQGLLADPLPAVAIKNPPPIVIRNGTVELCSGGEPAAGTPSATVADGASADRGGAILRDVNLRIEPAQGAGCISRGRPGATCSIA